MLAQSFVGASVRFRDRFLVRRAIELRDIRKRRAKKEAFVLEYDDVWVVFDLEKPNDIRRELARRAIDYGKPQRINFAVSDPCFEYWLLLHIHYTTAAFFECNDVITQLKARWGSYEKGKYLPPDLFENSLTAVQHAERCRRDYAKTGGGPTTAIDLILRSLNNATRSHLRIQLD